MKLHLSEQKKILFIKTSVWNSIKNIFQVKKDLDISKYLISIKILENKVIIRTNKPIFNSWRRDKMRNKSKTEKSWNRFWIWTYL